MDCLLIGFSSFARRRVIPALAQIDAISTLHVASRSATADQLSQLPKLGRVFDDYDDALRGLPPGLVYISLTNDAHARWVERAVAAGNHVIVDKPAVTALSDAERLVAAARERSVVLAEAVTYAFHPVIAHVKQLFDAHDSSPTHVTAIFTPPLPIDNFRYQRALGGGALLDTGPYFATVGRLLWDADPESVHATITSRSIDGQVDTGYSALARYPGGCTVIGHFAFTTEYCNRMHLLGPALEVDVPRVFSTPPDMVTELSVRHRDKTSTHEVPAASAVRRFVDAVVAAIDTADADMYGEILLRDARVLDRLLRAAEIG